MLKREALERIGYDDRALVPVSQKQLATLNDKSGISQGGHGRTASNSALEPYARKPKPIEYLERNRRDTRESVKDFVDHSRQILMAQIAISEKEEATEALRMYISMEAEKLEEAKQFLQEDKEKF